MTTDSEPYVTLEVDSGVGTITLNSPLNRNALSARLRNELAECLDHADHDSRVRVIVLTHRGPAFCSGADLKEMKTAPQNEPPESPATMPRLIEHLWHSAKPVLAVLNGPARAGGLGLVAACDLVISANTVDFALTEVRIGAVPAIISAPLSARVQAAPLHELMVTGRTIDALRAQAIGLVDAVASPEAMAATRDSYLSDLLRGAPGALAATKQLDRSGDVVTHTNMTALQDLSLRHFGSDEAREGMRAFLEKRAPAWVPDSPIQDESPSVDAAQEAIATLAPAQQRIVDSFTRHVATGGYDGTKLSAIAAELGISQGTIIHHFGSKEHLLATMHERYMTARIGELTEIVQVMKTPEERMAGILFSFVLAYRYSRDATIAAQREIVRLRDSPSMAAGVALRRRYFRLVAGVVDDGVAAGVFRPTDTTLETFFMFGASQWMWTWYQVDGPLEPEEASQFLARSVLSSLLIDRSSIDDLVATDGATARAVMRILAH